MGTVPTPTFLRWTGRALAAGGAATILLNALLTPYMPTHAPFTEVAASRLFLWRQSASAVAVALLLVGSVGLYLRQADRAGRAGAIGFVLAFFGSAGVFAWEWVDVFVLRSLALRAPQALQALEDAKGIDLYDLGALGPMVTFALGWIALSITTIRARSVDVRGAWLVIAGLALTPLLTAALPGLWGAVAGNAILGSGWIALGRATSSPSGAEN